MRNTAVTLLAGLTLLASACSSGSDTADSSPTATDTGDTSAVTSTPPATATPPTDAPPATVPSTTATVPTEPVSTEPATTETVTTETVTTETVTTEPPATVPATTVDPDVSCRTEPWAPPFLPDMSPVGSPDVSVDDDGATSATWSAGTANEVVQSLDSPDDSTARDAESFFEIAERFDEVIAVGEYEAAVVPIGDPFAPVGIAIRESNGDCLRQYTVTGDLGEAGADDFARAWLNELAGN